MTRRPPPKFNLEVIKQIYETQHKLFQEDSRFVVESYCRKEQLASLTQKANDSFRKEKEHFEIAQNFITEQSYDNKASAKKKSSREQNLTFINKENLIDKKIKIPDLINMTKFVFSQDTLNVSKSSRKDKGAQNNTSILDQFTFSVIPSYFDFFWTNSSIQRLIYYFNLINNDGLIDVDQYNSIARAVFVTPGFLLYSLYAFQPIFSKLLNYTEKTINNFFKDELSPQKFSSTIARFNYMIPKEVIIAIWCSKKPSSTFYHSFLKQALSSSNGMYIYNLLNVSQVPSKEILSTVKHHLKNNTELLNSMLASMSNGNPFYESLRINISDTYKSVKTDEEFKDSIILAVNATSRYKVNDDDDEYESDNLDRSADEDTIQSKELFNFNDQKYCPEIFQPMFLSSNDLNLFNFVNGKSSSYVTSDRLEYFRVFNEQEEAQDNIFNGAEKTMAGQVNIYQSLLRHLLQLTDPLPKFTEMPSNITNLSDFINVYLIERGDIATYSKRKHYGQFLLDKKNLNITEILKKVGFSRKNDIMALSAFTNVEKKLDVLVANSNEARKNMYLILDSQKKEFVSLKAPNQASEYFKNPNLFINDFTTCEQKLHQYSPDHANKIVFSRLMNSEKIDLQSFIEFRSNKLKNKQPLKKLDQEFSDILAKGTAIKEYVNQYLPTKHTSGDGVFDKMLYVRRYVDAFELNYYNNTFQRKSSNHESNVLEANSIGEDTYSPNDYEECKCISDMVIEAFQEKSLIRKMDILSRCLSKMRNDLYKGYPPNRSELAEPEFEPAHCAIIMRINPPNFYSNYIFLHDMIGFLPAEDIFVGYSRSVKNYFDLIVNYIFSDPKKSSSCILFNEDE